MFIKNPLRCLISNPQHPWQPGILITAFQMTQQSPQCLSDFWESDLHSVNVYWAGKPTQEDTNFRKCHIPCQQCATHRALLSHLSIFSGLLEGRDYYSHFTQKETEAQGDEMTSLKQVIIKWQSWDLNPELPNFKTRGASALLQNTRASEPVEVMTYGYVFPVLFHLFISNNSPNSRNCSLWI